VKGERPGLRLAWRDWHRRDARPCYRRAGLLGGARPRRGRAMVRSRHDRPWAGVALARRQSDERAQGGLRCLRAVAPARLSVAVASGVNEVRIGLAVGGRWIRTLTPPKREDVPKPPPALRRAIRGSNSVVKIGCYTCYYRRLGSSRGLRPTDWFGGIHPFPAMLEKTWMLGHKTGHGDAPSQLYQQRHQNCHNVLASCRSGSADGGAG
jgi:hypothetical protein